MKEKSIGLIGPIEPITHNEYGMKLIPRKKKDENGSSQSQNRPDEKSEKSAENKDESDPSELIKSFTP